MDPAPLCQLGLDAGLVSVGVARARAWTATRGRLERHRAGGLAGSMQFTLRRPARSSDPGMLLRGASSIVVGAHRYDHRVPDRPSTRCARVARYAAEDHYRLLRERLDPIAEELRRQGYRAVVVADDNALVDREVAWRAGLGWYGRNSNLLMPGGGSWVVLGSVVTTAAIRPTGPPVADGCGSCRRCVDGCPTRAIVGPGVVDARRCLSWVLQAPGPLPLELRRPAGDRLYGCDDCQEVCPPNRRGGSEATVAPPGSWVDAVDALAMDDEALLARFGRWYIAGRDPSVLRRNLLLVLGNAGDPADPAVQRVVRAHLTSDDPVLAEQARWSLTELGRRGRMAGPGGGPAGVRENWR